MKEANRTLALILIFISAVVLRIYAWSHLNSLTWDEALHTIPGIAIVRFLKNDFSISYLQEMISNYLTVLLSFSFYPYGYPLFSVFSFLFLGLNELAARLPSMVFSLLIIHAVYILSKKLFGERMALIAAFVAAVNPWFIIWGGRALTDIPMTTLGLYALYFILTATEQQKSKYWIFAGLCSAFAFLMKPTAILPIPFFVLAGVAHAGFRILLRRGFFIFLFIVFFSVFSYFGIGLLAKSIFSNLGVLSHHQGLVIYKAVFHWLSSAVTFAEDRDPTWHTFAGWTYYLELLPVQLGVTVVLFGILGSVILLKDKGSRGKVILILLFIFFAYLGCTFLNNKDTRYTIIYLPFFCILAAAGICAINNVCKGNIPTFLIKTGVIILILIESFKILPKGDIWETPYTGLDQAAEAISRQEKGLVIYTELREDMVNPYTITFYMLAKDPKLDYLFYWDNMDKLDYVGVLTEKPNIPKALMIFEKETKPRLYVVR